MEIPEQIQPFWSEFLKESAREKTTPLHEVFYFADSESLANSLADLVLKGVKTATSSLRWGYEAEGEHEPQQGELCVVTNWVGTPLCVIETTEVQVKAFEDVDEAFAAAEGEGDRSLAYWREVHWAFFGRVCKDLKRDQSPQMTVVCQRFKVVFLPPTETECHC